MTVLLILPFAGFLILIGICGFCMACLPPVSPVPRIIPPPSRVQSEPPQGGSVISPYSLQATAERAAANMHAIEEAKPTVYEVTDALATMANASPSMSDFLRLPRFDMRLISCSCGNSSAICQHRSCRKRRAGMSEQLEQAIRACLPIEGYEGATAGFIETDRMGIDDMVASLVTLIHEREAHVLSEVYQNLQSNLKENLFSPPGLTASAQMYIVKFIAGKLGIASEQIEQPLRNP